MKMHAGRAWKFRHVAAVRPTRGEHSTAGHSKKQKHMKTTKTNPAAAALEAARGGVSQITAQATANANCHVQRFLANVVAGITMALAASAHAGVNLETTTQPGYVKPLTLYVRDGHIYGAWAVGNKGNRDASAFEVLSGATCLK